MTATWASVRSVRTGTKRADRVKQSKNKRVIVDTLCGAFGDTYKSAGEKMEPRKGKNPSSMVGWEQLHRRWGVADVVHEACLCCPVHH